MSVTIECPCGHTVRLPDGMDRGRVKCTVCGELLAVSDAKDDTPNEEVLNPTAGDQHVVAPEDAFQTEAPPPAPPSGRSKSEGPRTPQPERHSEQARQANQERQLKQHSSKVTHFHGHAGFRFVGLPIPSFFSQSSLTLLSDRARLKSSGFFCTRRVDLLLSGITSGEIRRCPAWYLLVPGILLLAADGLGLIFLIAFLFVRHSFLILNCGATSVVVRFKADDTDACAVADAILQAAINERQGNSANGASKTAAE